MHASVLQKINDNSPSSQPLGSCFSAKMGMKLKWPFKPIVGVLIKVTFYVVVLAAGDALLSSWKNQLPNWRGDFDNAKGDGVGRTPKSLFTRLVRGEERKQLEITGFSCQFDLHTEICISAKPVRISNSGLTVHVPSDESLSTHSVRPYAKRVDETALKPVTAVQVLRRRIDDLPACNSTYDAPTVVFSSGLTGNTFHEFSEIIIPLFLTSRHFHSHVKFVITDYNQRWVEKYDRILNGLSNYKALNLVADGIVHCFPGAVIGLRYHDHLALNTRDVPSGHSMQEFRRFMRESYNVKIKNVLEMRKLQRPVLIVISRESTRKILNEEAVVKLARKLGFQVQIADLNTVSNLGQFSRMLSSCSVFVGVHGAGLVNEIFLPDGAVVIQVVPLGLDWASTNYYAAPLTTMNIQYLEYRIEPWESSVTEKYRPNHAVIVDPGSIFAKGYEAVRAVYLSGQDVTINLARFKETLVEAMRLVRHSKTFG